MEGWRWIRQNMQRLGLVDLPHPDEFKLISGGIVGAVDLVACVTKHNSPWFFGPYGFVLANPEAQEFRPCRGMLGFFEVTIDHGIDVK